MMQDKKHIPPTEAELDWLRSYAAIHVIPVLTRTCDEIRRLQALCGDTATFIEQIGTAGYPERMLACERLRAASEGRG